MARAGKLDATKYKADAIFYCPSNSPETPDALTLGYRANIGNGSSGVFVDRTSAAAVGLEDITDGKKNTFLLSESAQITDAVWHPVSTNDKLGFKYISSGESSLNDVSDDGGQASSFHQEGFNVAYCDGHTDFFYWDPEDPNAATNYTNLFKAKTTHNAAD